MTENSSSKGNSLSLPGQPTEEAVAEVGTVAGKSLVRGLSRLGNATIAEWASKREAKAEAVRLAIETEAKIKADTALADVRREQELAEFEHRAVLERRAARFRIEMAREQSNLEAIERRAIEFTERASESNESREIDDDWLFRFADLAQKVSDDDVQALWARALSSAAMQGTPKLSAAALQTLGLFDKHIAESFRRAVAAMMVLGFLPVPPPGENDVQSIDIATLGDLGVINATLHRGAYRFGDFSFEESTRVIGKLPGELHNQYSLTLRGAEIAEAVFRRSEDLSLKEGHEEQYLRLVLAQEFEHKRAVTILPKPNTDRAIAIRVTPKNSTTQEIETDDWKGAASAAEISARLRKLLIWAEQGHDIQIRSHVTK